MINAPTRDIVSRFEQVLGRPLTHVPAAEWEYFKSVDGAFQPSDWQKMPVLYRELTRGKS